ncbi:MAG: hypothetical protein U5S82_18130 [Gammaproteobacteria bacterium]|nr:hypothetical protein [Gammaproteobacteria bacterium]
MKGFALASCIAAAAAAPAADFSFDMGRYQKQPYEVGGYFQGSAEHIELDDGAALSALRFPAGAPAAGRRYRGVLEVSGLYRLQGLTFKGLFHAEALDDVAGSTDDAAFYEGYVEGRPAPRWTLSLGKRALRWGKGYAFTTVGFVERAKDATDPDLAREGFKVAAVEYVRSAGGPLQTLSLTALALPVRGTLNDDFGATDDTNLAARLYLLYRDTDIDLMVRTGDSRPDAVGLDFSRNLAPHFAIHGEVAWQHERRRPVLDPANRLRPREAEGADWLLGLRYLTATETTWIAEYYHNGAGYSSQEMRRFYALARSASDDPALRPAARGALEAGYGRPQAMRDYVYLKVSQKEPFDALYWNAGLTAIVNLHDASASVIPEVVYAGLENVELRGRIGLLAGGRDSEFGERQNDWRAELRLRYFF